MALRVKARWQFILAAGVTACLLAATFGAGLKGAQQTTEGATALVVKGAVKQELHLTMADLKTAARVKVTAKDHDGTTREYEGVALESLLAKAGASVGGELRGKNMTLVVIAEAGDGYRTVFSLAELDDDFAREQVIVADTEDGKALDAAHGPLRLVVPGDKRQGRWVRLLKTITVQKAGE